MPAADSEPDPLTIDQLHQYAYCPRRMHLMCVDGRWDNNVFTEEGREAHSRVDAKDQALILDAGSVEGAKPEPEIECVGHPYTPHIRCQIV